MNENFDLLGGTSLEYVEVISEVNKIFHTNMNLCGKFKTIIEMAGEVENMKSVNIYMNHRYQEAG